MDFQRKPLKRYFLPPLGTPLGRISFFFFSHQPRESNAATAHYRGTELNPCTAIASHRGELHAGASNYEFVRRPTQGVSKSCTPPRGAPEIPPRGHARLDQPTNLAPAMRTRFAWTLVPTPPPSRQIPNRHPTHRGLPGLVRRARTYPW